jgi:hypothetical protein
MSTYSITEPHPSVPKSKYMHSGRGGAGNFAQVNPENITAGQSATGPASIRPLKPSPPDSYFTAGRGGAGNIHRERERAIFSFDEELERQRRMTEHQAPIYHVGRGGAGNLVEELRPRMGSRSSASSANSSGSNFNDRVRGSMDGAWTRIVGSFSK